MLRRSVSFIALFILVLAAASAPACWASPKNSTKLIRCSPAARLSCRTSMAQWMCKAGTATPLRFTREDRETQGI